MPITNKIGAPVTGEDFFGRAGELLKAHRYLNEGQSLLLSAPRRIGKSSLAKRLIADKSIEGWKCIYIDLQGIATQEAFLHKLIEAFTGSSIMERTGQKVKNFLSTVFNATDGVELGGIKLDLSHYNKLEATYNQLSDTLDYEHDTLIVIDELPLFLSKLMAEDGHNRNEVEFLLNWFRSLRQHDGTHLRWLFCGSVGLRNFTNHHRMSQAINDLVDFNLGELPVDEAKGLLNALAKSYKLEMSEGVVAQTLELLQWPIPYFIQLLIDKIISQSQATGVVNISTEDVKQAIEELSHSDYFRTWDERLDEYRDLEDMARLVLDELSVAETGLTKEKLLQIAMRGHESTDKTSVKKNLVKVLEMLEHDGYIMRSGDNRKFRSPLLRKWWIYKFVS